MNELWDALPALLRMSDCLALRAAPLVCSKGRPSLLRDPPHSLRATRGPSHCLSGAVGALTPESRSPSSKLCTSRMSSGTRGSGSAPGARR